MGGDCIIESDSIRQNLFFKTLKSLSVQMTLFQCSYFYNLIINFKKAKSFSFFRFEGEKKKKKRLRCDMPNLWPEQILKLYHKLLKIGVYNRNADIQLIISS